MSPERPTTANTGMDGERPPKKKRVDTDAEAGTLRYQQERLNAELAALWDKIVVAALEPVTRFIRWLAR